MMWLLARRRLWLSCLPLLMLVSCSPPPPPNTPPPAEVLATVMLTITSGSGEARNLPLELKAGEDVAVSAVRFAEENNLGASSHVMDLAKRLQEAAETRGALERAKELANATTWLKTAVVRGTRPGVRRGPSCVTPHGSRAASAVSSQHAGDRACEAGRAFDVRCWRTRGWCRRRRRRAARSTTRTGGTCRSRL